MKNVLFAVLYFVHLLSDFVFVSPILLRIEADKIFHCGIVVLNLLATWIVVLIVFMVVLFTMT
jgi:hypothetical protein